jgi:hypothetical protein
VGILGSAVLVVVGGIVGYFVRLLEDRRRRQGERDERQREVLREVQAGVYGLVTAAEIRYRARISDGLSTRGPVPADEEWRARDRENRPVLFKRGAEIRDETLRRLIDKILELTTVVETSPAEPVATSGYGHLMEAVGTFNARTGELLRSV